ncbi:hypothetical protein V7S43_002561 [Phytophthora oleae]|uniref:DDE Tnp4 domain-containing protein n=1 Tax=Phytophthora oleae TaxID=2107226 RepID=A0ABD3G0A8_9STRA
MEDTVVFMTSLAGLAVSLAVTGQQEGQQEEKVKQKRTVTVLHFDALLTAASCEAWFVDNLRCSRSSFIAITRFLHLYDILFATAASKKYSYEKKVAAALHFFASSGGYRETAAAMGMNKSYVIDIVDEVARVLYAVADDVIAFPSCQDGWDDIERNFAVRRVSSELWMDR